MLCALYYDSRDYFEIIPDTVSLSEDKLSVTKITEYNIEYGDTSFGSMLIPSTSKYICKWDLKIDNLYHRNGVILVGISSKPFNPNVSCHTDAKWKTEDSEQDIKDHHAYVYGSGGQNKRFEGDWEDKGPRFGVGDVVSVHLDLKENKLTFCCNDVDSEIKFNVKKGENIEYRLAVVLFDKDNQVTIKDFNQWFTKEK